MLIVINIILVHVQYGLKIHKHARMLSLRVIFQIHSTFLACATPSFRTQEFLPFAFVINGWCLSPKRTSSTQKMCGFNARDARCAVVTLKQDQGTFSSWGRRQRRFRKPRAKPSKHSPIKQEGTNPTSMKWEKMEMVNVSFSKVMHVPYTVQDHLFAGTIPLS